MWFHIGPPHWAVTCPPVYFSRNPLSRSLGCTSRGIISVARGNVHVVTTFVEETSSAKLQTRKNLRFALILGQVGYACLSY